MIIDPAMILQHTGSNYPNEFKSRVAGRIKQRLGDVAGLKNFGVNLVHLAPGSQSALRHWHSRQDEFIYVLSGTLTLMTDAGEQTLTAGMAAGFPAGEANGHHLVNRSDAVATYLEVGDRSSGDAVTYPDDDLVATLSHEGWHFTHKDGTAYASSPL